MTVSTALDTTVARALVYRFLGQGYSYPGPALVESMLESGLWDQLRASEDVLNLGARETIDRMQAAIEQHCNDTQKLLQDLQVEYTYLFITAVPHVPASPHESVYLGQGSLMGEPVSEVLRAYREAGLIMSERYQALPDHVAAELEFMFYLLRQEVLAAESSPEEVADVWRRRRRRFLSEHLLRWVPLLMERITSSTRQPFYRLLATLTEAMLRTEEEYTNA